MMAEDKIYEICDYNERTGQIKLRLMFDPNGILIAKDNTNRLARKDIRALWLEKHYLILPQDDEYQIRQNILKNKDCKLIIKYQVIQSEGEPLCLTNQILPEGLDMSKYDLGFNKNDSTFNKVVHKEYGPVVYEA